jgi:hypothetical protein
MLLRWAPIVVVLGAAGVSAAGCSNGTTPVCDDAGSCLISSPDGDDGGVPEAGGADDANGAEGASDARAE